MSDAAVRALERRAQATGAVEDRAAWLTARVRAGLLSQEKLALAAYCHDAAARSVLVGHGPHCEHAGEACGPETWCPACGACSCITYCTCADPGAPVSAKVGRCFGWEGASLNAWATTLTMWGDETQFRAALAAAQAVMKWALSGKSMRPDVNPWLNSAGTAVWRAEEYLANPSEENFSAMIFACAAARRFPGNAWWGALGYIARPDYRSVPLYCDGNVILPREAAFADVLRDGMRPAVFNALIAWATG